MKFDRRSFVHRIFVLSAGLAFLSFATSLEAAPNNNKNAHRPTSKKGKAAELPIVKKVSNTSITVGEKYFEVNEFTVVMVNGEKATLADITPGMQASVTGGVKDYGANREETVYKASRIIARTDNELSKKAEEFNKNAAKNAAKNANQKKKKRN
jgi:hypothetical protein